jgi:hypothetical protein
MRSRRVFCAIAVLPLVVCAALEASAHTRSISYSSWQMTDEGAEVHARVSLLDLSRLAFDPYLDVESGGRAALYLAERLVLEAAGERCAAVAPPEAVSAPDGWVRFRWSLHCNASGAHRIESRVLLEVAPSHMHFARIENTTGGALERVLTEGESSFTLPAPGTAPAAASGTTLWGYVALGVEHILTGWDHLAFVIALLLLAARLGEVAALVTSFTIAHSVTLGLAVIGWVRPDGGAVEALIGFSIALVAAENAWILGGRPGSVPWVVTAGLAGLAVLALAGSGAVSATTLLGLALFSWCHFAMLERVERPARLRAAVAFAFGLVHGFGFAGVLAEMALPNDRLVPALFGFNVGVELGQLGIVALVWPALHVLAVRARAPWSRAVAEVGSAFVCALGLYWFLTRTLG